ncbi:hypothetical protein ACQ4PT_022908 [Festuca glaucescens]
MRLAAAAGALRPTAALLFRSHPQRLLPSLRRSSLPLARRRRHSYSSTSTALDDPPTTTPATNTPTSPAPPPPAARGGGVKAARRRARESPEGILKRQLDMCSRDADLPTALALYDAALDPATAIQLSIYHYNCLLYLCSNAAADESADPDPDAAKRGFEIFARMEAQGVEPNEATLTSVARLAAARRDPAMAFSLVRRMADIGTPPRLRTYGPALFAYCDAGDADGAARSRPTWTPQGSCLRRPSSPRCFVSMPARAGPARCTAAEAGVEEWDARKVKEGVVKRGGGWHGQGWLGKGQWNVGRSEMDTNGKCRRCGEKLVCIDIDPSETETFAKSLTELACKRDVREDFLRFQEWLHRHGPFDAVIDAANVGLYNSKAFSFFSGELCCKWNTDNN